MTPAQIAELLGSKPARISAAEWARTVAKLRGEDADNHNLLKIEKGEGARMTYTMEAISKAAAIAEGTPDAFTAVDVLKMINDLAAHEYPLAGRDVGFLNVIEKHETGRRLYRILKDKRAAGESDSDDEEDQKEPGPAKAKTIDTSHLRKLRELGGHLVAADPRLSKLSVTDPDRAAAKGFMKALDTPEGQRLYNAHLAELRTAS
jgi:hypothetical protein